jgi:hypothetical protein
MIDRTISHHRVIQKIGGGMGVLYEAQDLNLGPQIPTQLAQPR